MVKLLSDTCLLLLMVKALLMDDFGHHKISVAAMSFGALYCIANMIVLCDITS
jgi:hypothetical protein